jgi:hypothetical protein
MGHGKVQDHRHLIGGILQQLLETQKNLPRSWNQLNKYRRPRYEDLVQTLHEVVEKNDLKGHARVLIDAWDLDNMVDTSEFAKVMRKLLDLRFKVLVFSREQLLKAPDASHDIAAWKTLRITQELNRNDMAILVRRVMRQSWLVQEASRTNDHLEGQLVESILQGANGRQVGNWSLMTVRYLHSADFSGAKLKPRCFAREGPLESCMIELTTHLLRCKSYGLSWTLYFSNPTLLQQGLCGTPWSGCRKFSNLCPSLDCAML